MAYFEKLEMEITASSSGKFGTLLSTGHWTGYIHAIHYTPGTSNPLIVASSPIIRLRADSTAGRLLCQSSSGFGGAAAAYIYPRRGTAQSTGFTIAPLTSQSNERIPVAAEKICLTRQAKSTAGANTGSTQGLKLTVFIEGPAELY